ncbi:VOC family protein [Caenimonas sedimenti]|uniref:VOC family protein n=1 Tax=Caenimonas sedimenti TaxID=2596921 RepID=A0A562ZGY1_9BURK|nr:VOC family protein [Caenimonas sedimenti]TWO66964.1 VOC family protein [Caenimonas sedimenti]
MTVKELFPYLHVRDAAAAIRFYVEAFGARELFRLTEPSGRLGHGELDFNGATLMISDEYPEMNIRGPQAGGPTAVSLHIHVEDADAVIAKAVELGATLEMAPQDQFYGERSGVVRDPFGHRWNVGHSIEEVTPEEMQRRYDALMKGS